MHILQLANKFPYPPHDGGAIATLNLTKGLAQHGNQVTLFAINTSKHYFNPALLPEDINHMARFITVYVNTDISVFQALKNLFFSSLPYNAERFISNQVKKRLSELFSTHSFDVIQIEGLYMCPYIPIIREYTSAIIVFRAHNIEYEIWNRMVRKCRNPLKRLYLNNLARRIERMERAYMNQYDGLVPITGRDAEQLNEMGNKKPVHVTSAGIDLQSFPEVKQGSASTLFHIGGLDWPPNQEGLIWFLEECWPILVEKHPGLQFHIAGRNAPSWLIRKFSVSGVYYHGEVENAYSFMEENGIMIVPLFSGSGMRIKIIEGMAMKKPVVSTSIGAEGIPVKNGHHIWIANHVDEFIKGIDLLINNKDKKEQLANGSYRFILKNYDNFAISKSLIHFYNALINDTSDHILD